MDMKLEQLYIFLLALRYGHIVLTGRINRPRTTKVNQYKRTEVLSCDSNGDIYCIESHFAVCSIQAVHAMLKMVCLQAIL
jgi:hypothetical protein